MPLRRIAWVIGDESSLTNQVPLDEFDVRVLSKGRFDFLERLLRNLDVMNIELR